MCNVLREGLQLPVGISVYFCDSCLSNHPKHACDLPQLRILRTHGIGRQII